MEFRRLDEVIIFILLTISLLIFGMSQGMASERINPMRFEGDRKSWQLSLNISRYLDGATIHTRDKRGLWEEEKTVEGTSYTITSTFDVNKGVGFRGGFSYYSDYVRSKKTNLWTGAKEITSGGSGRFGDPALKLKLDVWENSEIKTHFFIPLLGGSVGFGLVWSRDPLMVLPKLTTDGSNFGLNTGISFVANSRMALTGNVSLKKGTDRSIIGLGLGMVYHNGEYDGVQIAAKLRRGNSTRISLELGLSYGEQK